MWFDAISSPLPCGWSSSSPLCSPASLLLCNCTCAVLGKVGTQHLIILIIRTLFSAKSNSEIQSRPLLFFLKLITTLFLITWLSVCVFLSSVKMFHIKKKIKKKMFHMSYLIAVNDIFMCLDISVPFFILEVLSLSPSLLSSSVDSV